MGRGIYGGRSRAEAGVSGERAASRLGCSWLTPAPLCGLRPFQGAGRGTDVPIVHLGSLLGKLQQLRAAFLAPAFGWFFSFVFFF